MRLDYAATREAVRDTLTPYGNRDIKAANKAMKALFGERLSQIKGGQDTVSYYILVEGDDGYELDYFTWDFTYGQFAV